jgi:very-short-patch-repair endonuclease
MLAIQCKAFKKPIPEKEYKFDCTGKRRFRFDFAWPKLKLAVEVEGGIWIKGLSGRGGAHSLPSNIIRDMEKNNLAVKQGWRVFRFTPDQIQSGDAFKFIEDLLHGKP